MPVTLGPGPGDTEGFSAGWKKGSFFQELPTDGDGAGGGTGATGGAGVEGTRDGLLKNCVKLPSDDPAGAGAGGGAGGRCALPNNWVTLPSADAESDAPGDEKPLEREGPEDAGAGRSASSEGRAVGAGVGVTPETKMRVNSP